MSKIWIDSRELVKAGISESYMHKKASESRSNGRNTWITKKEGKNLSVDYDSLPEPTKAKLPSRSELESVHVVKEISVLNNATENLLTLHKNNCDIMDYHWFEKQVEDKVKAWDLFQAAGWLKLLNKYRTKTETRTIDFDTKSLLRTAVVETLINNAKEKKGQHLYGFKVTNVTVLQRKELEWSNAIEEAKKTLPLHEAKRAGLATLVNGNFDNSNRRVLGKINEVESDRILLPGGTIDFSEWNARMLVWEFMNPGKANKYDFENLYRRYELRCEQDKRPVAVKISAVKEFLTCNEVDIYIKRERHGWAEFDKMLPHVYGEKSTYSLSKGGFDGFTVDFNTRMIVDGKPKQLMLTVVAVFDYMSEAITGFDIGLVEDGLMVRNAYRNHLNLMGGRSFIEIESDRFSGNVAEETKRIFSQTCQHFTQPTPNDPQGKAPNPKARYVERLLQEWNRLTQNVEDGWKGTNITSIDKNRKPNPDYRKGNFVEGYAESVKQIIDLVNIYNNDTYNREKSRMQVCLENINPEAPTIARETISMLLNQSTEVKMNGALIAFDVNRKTYEYAFPEYDLHVHAMKKGYKVKVYFDETDMSSIDVFGENEVYIATLGKLKRVVKAKGEQTAEDTGRAAAMRANRSKMVERISGVSRKLLEAQANDFGIDISNMSIEEAQEVIAGMIHITPEELFAEALNTDNAKQTSSYYEDRLLRSQGVNVPVVVTKADRKSSEQMMREQARKKFNLNNVNLNEEQ